MIRHYLALAALATLVACNSGTNPFIENTSDATDEDTTDTDPDNEGGITGGGGLPPGTSEPSSSSGIFRYEDESENGGGYVQEVSYNANRDRLIVDNLAFDGENRYSRGTAVDTLGSYAVYEADQTVEDFLDGDEIGQIVPYRAIFGTSLNSVDGDPRTSFAIVRTGGYVDYGFGGFVYQRNGGVTLPETGQATFEGDYAGIRVFNNSGGIEYTTGDMFMSIDFDDFNTNAGVRGRVFNRQVFDANGDPVLTGTGDGELPVPNITWVIEAGEGAVLTENGEMTGNVLSVTADDSGALTEYETGSYYAIIAGDTTDPDDGGEIVGVLVIESTDPRFEAGVTAQETGGFILYR